MIRRSVRSDVRRAILSAHSYRCHYCGAAASEVDHIKPVKNGGDDSLANLIAACHSCNRSKRGDDLPHEKMNRALAAASATSGALSPQFPGYTGAIYYTSSAVRKSVSLPSTVWHEITDYRVRHSFGTDVAAFRHLIQIGLRELRRRRPGERKK